MEKCLQKTISISQEKKCCERSAKFIAFRWGVNVFHLELQSSLHLGLTTCLPLVPSSSVILAL